MSKLEKAAIFVVFTSLAVWGFMLSADDPLLGPVIMWIILRLPVIIPLIVGIAVCIAIWRLMRNERRERDISDEQRHGETSPTRWFHRLLAWTLGPLVIIAFAVIIWPWIKLFDEWIVGLFQ